MKLYKKNIEFYKKNNKYVKSIIIRHDRDNKFSGICNLVYPAGVDISNLFDIQSELSGMVIDPDDDGNDLLEIKGKKYMVMGKTINFL